MKILTTKEHEALDSLLWIVTHEEAAFKAVLSAFNASRNDRLTQKEFLESLDSLHTKKVRK